MSNQEQRIEELISAYLDGELSAQESLEFQQYLDADSRVAQQLADMQKMRSVLLAIPAEHLESSFADRVLAAAQARAESMDNPPAWIRPRVHLSDNTELTLRTSSRDRVRAALMVLGGIAAAVLLGFFVIQIQSNLNSVAKKDNNPSNPKQGLVDQIPDLTTPDLNTPDSLAQDSPLPSTPQEPLAEMNANSTARSEGTDAQVDPEPLRPNTPDADIAKVTPDVPSIPDVAVTPEVVSNEQPMTDEERQVRELERMLESGKKLRVVLVVDVNVSREAWENETLVSILNSNDIPLESEVVVDDKTRESLIKSRFVGPQDGQGELKDNIALVCVKGRASRLDTAISQVYLNAKSFPAFSMDLAIDPPTQELISNLEGYREFGEFELAASSAEGKPMGIARSLSKNSLASKKIVAQFAASERRGPVVEDRSAWKSPTGFDAAMNPVDYALFVLRPVDE